MRLWTIQPQEVYELLQEQKVIHCDETKATWLKDEDDITFRKAYNWLIAEMRKRVGEPPNGVVYPFWAWHTLDWKTKKPDLRKAGLGTPNQKAVCLELEIPDSDVLLSDEDNWYYVLNDYYFGSALSESEWDSEQNYLEALTEKERKSVIEESWKKIFILDKVSNDWYVSGRDIQATFWELRLEQVKEVRYFKAR